VFLGIEKVGEDLIAWIGKASGGWLLAAGRTK